MLYRPHGQGLDAGHYQLIAVVTHKGRSADGGHYVGWVHKSGDEWL
jgi:ubiquitin carboxyl-terminal hydrolase 14